MSKRARGEGSYFKTKSGLWEGQLMDGYKEDGSKNIVCFSGYSKSEVQQKVRQYLFEKENGQIEVREDMRFSDWADFWYSDYRTEVQPSTYSCYIYTLNLLKKNFEKKSLQEIKTMDVNAFLNDLLKKDYSHSMITKCRAMLYQIFDAAEANGLVSQNPVRKAKKLRNMKKVENEKDAFTDEEVEQLQVQLPDSKLGNSILLMIGTGLRTQELLALKPGMIAKDGSSVRVDHAIKTVDGKPTYGCPKSARSARTIPVPEKYRKNALALLRLGGRKYIWESNRESGLYDVGTFRRQYYRLIREIEGVRPLSPHCCRHTYVTRLEAEGIPLEQIARLVGHESIETTIHYDHISMSTLEKAVSVLK